MLSSALKKEIMKETILFTHQLFLFAARRVCLSDCHLWLKLLQASASPSVVERLSFNSCAPMYTELRLLSSKHVQRQRPNAPLLTSVWRSFLAAWKTFTNTYCLTHSSWTSQNWNKERNKHFFQPIVALTKITAVNRFIEGEWHSSIVQQCCSP